MITPVTYVIIIPVTNHSWNTFRLIPHEHPEPCSVSDCCKNNHARPSDNTHCAGPTKASSATRSSWIKQNAQATQNSLLKNVTRLRDRHFLFACGAHLVVDQAVVSDLPLGLLWWPPVDGDGSGGQGVGAQVDRRTGDMNCNTECQQLLTYNCTQNKQNKPPKSPLSSS